MAIRKSLELDWQGEQYKLLVNMEVIDRVDTLISIGVLASRQGTGDIRVTDIAKFISLVLNEAGATTNQESVYEGMFAGGAVTVAETNKMLTYILSAFFPETKKKDTSAKKTKAQAK